MQLLACLLCFQVDPVPLVSVKITMMSVEGVTKTVRPVRGVISSVAYGDSSDAKACQAMSSAETGNGAMSPAGQGGTASL